MPPHLQPHAALAPRQARRAGRAQPDVRPTSAVHPATSGTKTCAAPARARPHHSPSHNY